MGGTQDIGDRPEGGDTLAVEGRSSFEQWYRSNHDRLLDAAVLAAAGPDEAREVMSPEACRGAWTGGDTRRRPDDPTAWTFRVAMNAAHRRSRRRRTEHLALDRASPAPSAPSARRPSSCGRRSASCPTRQRLAVVLRYVGDLSEAQTAEVMGIAPGTVAATLSAARRAWPSASTSGRTYQMPLDQLFDELARANRIDAPGMAELHGRFGVRVAGGRGVRDVDRRGGRPRRRGSGGRHHA